MFLIKIKKAKLKLKSEQLNVKKRCEEWKNKVKRCDMN